MRPFRIGLICFAIVCAVAALLYPHMPARVPTHWGATLQPDHWMSPLKATLIPPVLYLAQLLLVLGFLRIDPKIRSLEKALAADPGEEARTELATSRAARDTVVSVVMMLIAALEIGVLALGAGLLREPGRPLALGMGAFLAIAGNFMVRVRPNWFVGIRTPWALSDDEVWRRTHRLGGRLMVLSGALLVVAALALPPKIVPAALFGSLGLAFLPPAVLSYFWWRQRAA